tara:strand:+ start:105 stop:899 length:795 start_codon:yes stop_codon:yes gene_type:complete
MIIYSGLPRSGTNLLKNILSQNNNIKISHESVLYNVVDSVLRSVQRYEGYYNYNENLDELEFSLKNFIQGGINQIDKKFEKLHINHNKQWSMYLSKMMDLDYKVIFSVRNIKDILSSFEEQRKTHLTSSPPKNLNCKNPLIGQLEQHELPIFFQNSISFLNEISFDLDKYKDKLLIVRYEDLITHPNKILNKIYSFLNINSFDHDFNNIKIRADHDMHVSERLGISHDVRPVLDKFVKKYSLPSDVDEYFTTKYHLILKLLGYI